MKKYPLLVLLLTSSSWASAQTFLVPALDHGLTQELMRSIIALLVLGLLSFLLLNVLRLVLDHQLKKRTLDVGASEAMVERLLSPRRSALNAALKGAVLLTAASIGLTAGYFTRPWGSHSGLLLLLSVALGYWVYYLFLKRLPPQ